MKKLTILIDVDNVLEDLHTPWVNALNKKYGTNVKPEEITSWGIEEYFPSLSRTQVFSPLHDKAFWKKLDPMYGAKNILERLKIDGHKLYVATSSHPDTVKYKCDFIHHNFGTVFSQNDIIIIHDKQLLNADVLIDDAPHNLVNANYTGILFSSPHNAGYNAKENNLYRADNWDDVYAIINNISKSFEDHIRDIENRLWQELTVKGEY